ncbi:hypothetical protein COB72_07140 [bacterium]|nr:MAG: hypothetical protein COB72_07140 [bacterium]
MDYAQLNALCATNAQPNKEGSLLERNLEALSKHSPLAAQQIRTAQSPIDIRFIETDEGIESVELGGVALASKRKPMQEAKRFAERFEPTNAACCAMVGFGIGYHCGTMLERLGSVGVIMCFEPDVELLHAVLERVDYTRMFETSRFFLVCQAEDSSTISRMFVGIEAVIGLGVEIIHHPPSAKRLGESGAVFSDVFCNVIKAQRTHVVTTLANARVTFRNAIMNLDHYSKSAGIESLKDSCKGKAAVVVAAGPSLERNLEMLADPKVRDSVVVIAVQTVLKQMLAKGIKPHFVAALDYHEISKRFYEGLSAEDVDGVRLIVEAKANPAILDAFPGEVLCAGDEMLDRLLGDELSREMGQLTMGGTVAHLCYYIARYLGCDPVILIGQDLGFSDGQYYASGAAIHQVWSGELHAHNTLEMMEWQRIVRMRGLLRKKTDIHGRQIYLDEQMATYLVQFEAEFQKDTHDGLLVIDATEGGVQKEHTTVMTLKDAIDAHGSEEPIELPATDVLRVENTQHQSDVRRRLDKLIEDSRRIVYLSEQSIELLETMIKHQDDQKQMGVLIGKVQLFRDQVFKMDVAYRLAETVNQVGVLNRMKQDRLIDINKDASAIERQKLQIERDIVNVQWIRDAANAVIDQLVQGREVLLGKEAKQTNDLDETKDENKAIEVQGDEIRRRDIVHAVVIADPDFGGLGTPRDLRATIANSMNALQLTLTRLDKASELDAITILTPDPNAIRELVGSIPLSKPIAIARVDSARFRERAERIGSARVQSSECWRGSIGMLCVYDEQVDPGLMAQVMNEHSIDACAIVGCDWSMIDSELVDRTVLRYRNQEADQRIAFSQAVPGLGTMVVGRSTIEHLAGSLLDNNAQRNHFATIGALIGYIPTAPQFDPIGKGVCVDIDPMMRDAGVRMIADTPMRVSMMRQAYQEIDLAERANGAACVRAFCEASRTHGRISPRTIVLETCTGRLAGGDWGMWKRNSVEPIERQVLSINNVHSLLGNMRSLRTDTALVFDGVGDPLMHPQAMDFVQLAKEDGVACVEMRTDLLHAGISAKELLESGIDILSVDVLAEHAETYAALTGQDRLGDVYDRVQDIFDTMRSEPTNTMWFVPRLTRCDAVYDDIEQFYDKWLMLCGSCVIDSLPRRVDGQRIQRLPIPPMRQQQMDMSTMYIQCDGAVIDRLGKPVRSINVFDDGIEQAYQQACAAMGSSQVEPKAGLCKAVEENAA